MKQIGMCLVFSASFALAQVQVQDVVIERTAGPANRMVFFAGGQNVKGAPYTADSVTESVQTLADGNRITRTNKSSFARDSEGRTRREAQIQHLGPLGSSPEAHVSISIDDPVAKVSYTLMPKQKKAIKVERPEPGNFQWKGMEGGEVSVQAFRVEKDAGEVQGDRNVQVHRFTKDAANREDLGTRNVEGVMAKGTRTRLKIPAGQMGNEREMEVVTETWYSDQLKTAVLTKHSDPRMGETTTRLTNIKLGEPPASLFLVPPDYTVEEGPKMRQQIIVRD
ncbi:MAG: hypothetical protein OHK0021_07210 [Bryobacter sp.]